MSVYREAVAITPPQIPGLTDWRPLARGGFAIVWEARQVTLDRLVAVKVDDRPLDAESERQRFLREAGAAGRMSSHPGIVTVHDAGILADNHPYLVMDLCPGGSLTRYLEADRRPSQQRVRDIGVRIADALAATHARGVLHRDVKPANLLVDAYDNVGLADFGLAALPGPGLASQETFQALTPAYTAPEILHRQPPVPEGDVYSLAATLYALLAGRPPRWPESGTPSLSEVIEIHHRPVAPLPDVDPAFTALLLQALSLEPADRPDAAELRDRLAALDLTVPHSAPVGGAPVAAHADLGGATAVGTGRAASVRRRHPVALLLLALLVAAVLVTGFALLGRDRQPVADPAPPATPASAAASPTAEPSPTSSSPTPSPEPLPAGFAACDAGGDDAYCPTEPECFGGVISVADSPYIATPQSCDRQHYYQTFAAGPLDVDVRQQSQLDDLEQARRLCRVKTLRPMLNGSARSVGWDVRAIPPQAQDGNDRFFRCVFGLDVRTGPIGLTADR